MTIELGCTALRAKRLSWRESARAGKHLSADTPWEQPSPSSRLRHEGREHVGFNDFDAAAAK